MARYLRQFIFLVYSLILQWPLWLLISVVGLSGAFKTLFLIYPTDSSECLDFCPDIPWLRSFFSGRPTPAGLIMDGWLPIGIYLLIPNTSMELARKKNRSTVEAIIRRMLWFQKLSGAKAIGLAGQLGPIFEKHRGTPVEHPFYSSTFGNIFSIQSAVNHLVTTSKMKPWQVSVAIAGGGEFCDQLEKSLDSDGYRIETIDVRYTRKGDIKLVDEKKTNLQLRGVDFVINLLPRGKDFLGCEMQRRIPDSATIIDFSRPQIPAETITQTVVMGNRVQSNGIYFFVKLPGGWKRHELPACSMPSLLASLGTVTFGNIEEFRLAARQLAFSTALSGAPRPADTRGNLIPVPAVQSAGNEV